MYANAHRKKTPYLLTPWSTVLLEKLKGSELVMNSRHFTEPQGSLPHSLVPILSQLNPVHAPHPTS